MYHVEMALISVTFLIHPTTLPEPLLCLVFLQRTYTILHTIYFICLIFVFSGLH